MSRKKTNAARAAMQRDMRDAARLAQIPHLRAALDASGGTRAGAAALLGITERTLYRLLRAAGPRARLPRAGKRTDQAVGIV